MDSKRVTAFETDCLVSTVKRVNELLDVVLQLPVCEERKGGYFCIANGDGRPIVVVAVGSISNEKAGKCFNLAQEKARRLAGHPAHRTSWESRDPDAMKFGGAVKDLRTYPFIYSFSGLPEQVDEALMLATAIFATPIAKSLNDEREGLKRAKRIAIANRNPYFKELMKKQTVEPLL